MIGVPIREALDWAKQYDSVLDARDPRFKGMVMILHREGTTLTFLNAFCVRRQLDAYIYTFTEHHGYHVYDHEDVEVLQFQERKYKFDIVME